VSPPGRPTPFATAARFRAWLEEHHAGEKELVIQLFKNHARTKGMGYAEALDEALCYGWIDGVRRSHDQDSFTVRFTPRKPKSIWSAVNIRHVARLEAEGRMRPPGRAAFQARIEERSRVYSFESKPLELAPAYARKLRGNPRAWKYFQAQAPWYRRTCQFWVMSAKQEATRERRLDTLIECSARGAPVGPLDRTNRGRARSRPKKEKRS
jgi:uncharacterized protein YdeI (YjbR/CyaY-like superfamily)